MMSALASAHGFAGQRFFPATVLTDDPFVADEASLPTITVNPTAADGSRETDLGFDLSKRITQKWGITLADQWQHVSPIDAPHLAGSGPLSTGVQYQLFVNGEQEAIGLLNLGATWANTGRAALGAPAFTTLTPGFNFGKGFGNLFESSPFLRPFAVTGNLSLDFPMRSSSAGSPNPNTFNYGFAFEYSLPYLECCVKDIGLRGPLSQLIPLVELAFSTPVNRVSASQTTGTIQPGIIWAGQSFQVSAEAIIPATALSGHGIGWILQMHFYLDDLFPHSIGRPLLGA